MDSHSNVIPASKPARRRRPDQGMRWTILALSVVAVLLWAVAYLRPWWQFYLFAPQYPNGLVLDISLTGLGGDAREVNMLNHYIGMKGLDEAAALERRLAVYGVGLVAVLSVAFTLFAGKRWNWIILIPALGFPLGFVGDSAAWLHHFGHSLDPHAPLRIAPFTPEMFGWGEIGQFKTYAMPLSGFWLAVGALGCMLLAVYLRRRVCLKCPLAKACGATCPGSIVGRDAAPKH